MARIGIIPVECSNEMEDACVSSAFWSIVTDPVDLDRQIAAQNTPEKIAARQKRLTRYRKNRIAAERR